MVLYVIYHPLKGVKYPMKKKFFFSLFNLLIILVVTGCSQKEKETKTESTSKFDESSLILPYDESGNEFPSSITPSQ